MKSTKLTPRTIEYLAGILATALIAAGLLAYAWNEPQRLESAAAAQLQADLDGAMSSYAENCAVCHGLGGEGIGANPALSNPLLRETDATLLSKTIARGLYGTSMPAWSLEDGGPLSDYQISQLVSLVQHGDWQVTQDRVVNLGLAPRVPFTTQADPQIVESVRNLADGAVLAAGIELYAESCVACHGADGLGTTLAPALNDPAVRAKTAEELQRTLLLGSPGTLMAGWEKTLAPEQTEALLALIQRWDEVPAGAIPAPDRPVPVTAESLALGSELYTSTCSLCHGPEGQGSQRAPALNVRSFLKDTNDAAIQQIVTQGVPGTSMPAWGDRLTDADIQAIVGFLRSWEATAPEVAEPARIQGPWWRNNPAMGPQGAAGQTSAQPSTHAAQQASGQSNNPWSAPQAAWYETLDPRAWALGAGVTLSAAIMVVAALAGLRRKPPSG